MVKLSMTFLFFVPSNAANTPPSCVGCCFVGCFFVGCCFVGCCFVGCCFVGCCFVGCCFVGCCSDAMAFDFVVKTRFD